MQNVQAGRQRRVAVTREVHGPKGAGRQNGRGNGGGRAAADHRCGDDSVCEADCAQPEQEPDIADFGGDHRGEMEVPHDDPRLRPARIVERGTRDELIARSEAFRWALKQEEE